MKLASIVWIVMIAISLFGNAAIAADESTTAGFSGVVVDVGEGAPVSNVHIWIHNQSGNGIYETLTDRSGHFAIQLPDGYYDVLVGAPGFAPFCKRVWIRPGRPSKLKVRLGPDLEKMEDVF